MKRYTFLAFLGLSFFVLSCSSSTEPTHNVRGMLVVAGSDQPLSGATVILFSKQDTVITGADGKFEFNTEGEGSESVAIQGVGITDAGETSDRGTGHHDFGKIAVTVHATLAAYYPMDGNLNSQSGTTNGTLTPEATASTDRFGQTGKSVSFSAAGALGSIPHSQTFQFSSTKGFTISLWVRRPELPPIPNPGAYYPLIVKGPSPLEAGSLGFQLLTYVQSGITEEFRLRTNEGSEIDTRLLLAPETNWHHIVAIVDAEKLITWIMVDGVSQDQKFPGVDPFADGNYNNTDPIVLGGQISGRWFAGEIDDLRIFHGALDQLDINELYHERGF